MCDISQFKIVSSGIKWVNIRELWSKTFFVNNQMKIYILIVFSKKSGFLFNEPQMKTLHFPTNYLHQPLQLFQ